MLAFFRTRSAGWFWAMALGRLDIRNIATKMIFIERERVSQAWGKWQLANQKPQRTRRNKIKEQSRSKRTLGAFALMMHSSEQGSLAALQDKLKSFRFRVTELELQWFFFSGGPSL